MNYKYYNFTILTLLLFFCQSYSQENCDFRFNTLDTYSFKTAVDGNTQGCNTQTINNIVNYNIPQDSILNINSPNQPVTFVNQNNDPTLLSLGVFHPQNESGQGIRLNFRSQQGRIEENTTILNKNLGVITERYLNIDYSVLFQVPNHPHNLNFVRFSIRDLNSNLIIDEKCLNVNDDNGIDDDDSSDDLKNPNGNINWKYNEWSCISFDLNNYMQSNNLQLEIIAADCGEAFHDTLLYLDNICFSNTSCKSDEPCETGTISMNSTNINCPTDSFTISGNYALPSCDSVNPTNISLTLIPSNGGLQQTISQSSFSNNSYSFTLNPANLNLNSALEYDIIATAIFPNGETKIVSNPGKEITFNNCNGCNNYWVAILDEHIDGTQSGSNSVYIIANGNYPNGSNYQWTTTRQNSLVQTYNTTNNIVLVSASANNRIISASVTVSYNNCSETAYKIFDCPIPNADAQGSSFCSPNDGGGFGGFFRQSSTENIIPQSINPSGDVELFKENNTLNIYPNPVNSNNEIKISGLDLSRNNTVEIIDLSGNIKSRHQLKSNSLKIGNLKAGIYFLNISTEKGIVQKKIIVN